MLICFKRAIAELIVFFKIMKRFFAVRVCIEIQQCFVNGKADLIYKSEEFPAVAGGDLYLLLAAVTGAAVWRAV